MMSDEILPHQQLSVRSESVRKVVFFSLKMSAYTNCHLQRLAVLHKLNKVFLQCHNDLHRIFEFIF